MQAEALLGRILPPFRPQYRLDKFGFEVPMYVNEDTGETRDDPRLGLVPGDWEQLAAERTPDDPYYFVRFRNRRTEEEINSDPRLFPEALEVRGVKLETFALV
jgi:hypothetical protein